jgi:hypothetical protein
MKNLNRTNQIALICLALGTLSAGVAMARTGNDDSRGRGQECRHRKQREKPAWRQEAAAFRKAQREEAKAHFKAQREERKAAREARKAEEDPYAIVANIKQLRVQANKENTAFFEGMHNERIAFLEKMFAKYEVPQDKQSKITEQMTENAAEKKAKHEEQYKNVIEALDRLAAKSDLTKDDIRKAMKELHAKKGRGGKRANQGRGRKRGKRRGRGWARDGNTEDSGD